MLRELIARLNRSLSDRMVSARRRHTAPVKVWFEPDISNERAREAARSACILGETVDLSRTGLAILVPSIRFNEKYLVGHERLLNIEIDLPSGKVALKAMGKRYEKVGIHISTERFLVGVHIVGLEGQSRENYENFLKYGRRARRPRGSLELGID